MLDTDSLRGALAVTAPIFCLIALGYLAVRSGYFPPAQAPALRNFAARVAVPAMIFLSVAEQPLAQLFDGAFAAAYAGASLAVFAAVAAALRWRGRPPSDWAMAALGASVSNTIMVGYPIAAALFGAAALAPLALVLVVENALLIPLALLLAGGGDGGWRSALRGLRNPLMIALSAALALSASGWRPPAPLTAALAPLAQAVSGVALFAVGAMLLGLRARTLLADAGLIAAAKLALHPLAVALAMAAAPGLSAEQRALAIVIAACPMFGIYPVIGELHGQGPRCAAALLLATACAFCSLTLVIAWLPGG